MVSVHQNFLYGVCKFFVKNLQGLRANTYLPSIDQSLYTSNCAFFLQMLVRHVENEYVTSTVKPWKFNQVFQCVQRHSND